MVSMRLLFVCLEMGCCFFNPADFKFGKGDGAFVTEILNVQYPSLSPTRDKLDEYVLCTLYFWLGLIRLDF